MNGSRDPTDLQWHEQEGSHSAPAAKVLSATIVELETDT